MKTIYTPDDIQKMDSNEIKRGIDLYNLVEQAGSKIADTIQQCHSGHKALFFCGIGNNGADGFAAAKHLAKQYTCRIIIVGAKRQLSLSSQTHLKQAKDAGVEVFCVGSEVELNSATAGFHPDVVVDALLGSGATRFPSGLMDIAVKRINQFSLSATVVAVDIPTGINPSTGLVGENWVCADTTIAMQGLKPGLLMYPGADYLGDVVVAEVFETDYMPITERFLFEQGDVLSMRRSRHSHKGTYGRLGIIAGSKGFSGAGVLCARAALRSGCGLLTIAAPESVTDVYTHMLIEAMTKPLAEEDGHYGDCSDEVAAFLEDKDACVVGPGMGKGENVYKVVETVLRAGKPAVLDADALNALATFGMAPLKEAGCTVVTPHPGELARMMNVDIDDILRDPLGMAEACAREYDTVCVLKMSTTIVAAPGRTAFVTSGCAAMAKGGSGDVLAGCMGGLLASSRETFYCACVAAYVCGKAGELTQSRLGATFALPSDEIENLSEIFMQFE